jgi:23S rRNA (uracil1939-C5)-methyltransferase
LTPDPILDLGPIANGGETVARLPTGEIVFVSGGLPGETAAVALQQAHRGVTRGTAVDILQASLDRVIPLCPYFGECGGCQWQHASYTAQLAFKRRLLDETVRHHTGLQNLPMLPPLPAPGPWNYRHTAQLHITADGKLGFQRVRSHDSVAIDSCLIAHPLINEAILVLQEIVPAVLTREQERSRLSSISLRVGTDGDKAELLLICQGPESSRESARSIALGFTIHQDYVRGCWFVPVGSEHQRTSGRELLHGRATVAQRIGHIRFRIGPTIFFQVNPPQAAAIVDLMRAIVRTKRPSTVLDLFCGVGLFSLSVAEIAGHVAGADVLEGAIDLARDTAREHQIENAHFLAAPALAALTRYRSPSMVILDPPRAGCGPSLLAELGRQSPKTIAYLACDAVTLARDTSTLLHAGYRLESLRLIDLFPQTHHIEALAVLDKVSAPVHR